ncbi:class F sortase [Streptomyces triticagri]|uniref:Class F sortase n=1 Tax=Streptomyces triticagri TaxID=2293568 RepID=A0A372M5C1_9ACTN|nr:class F sortase [Streptomyces triticagri]RFU86128.1 class F sortase [Streptomyces triticagri]
MAHRTSGRVGYVEGVLVTALAVVAFAFTSAEPIGGPPQPTAAAGQTAQQPAGTTASPLAASRPLRVVVPAIGVDAPLTDLGIEQSGRLASPPEDEPDTAGWWADGPAPGTRGTAIIAGHVDVPGGPAVFYNLGALTPGTPIAVPRADGTTAHFRTTSVDVYDADDFPDDKVYADTDRPELRLITCGGGYDKKRRQYNGNVVVTAHLTTAPT